NVFVSVVFVRVDVNLIRLKQFSKGINSEKYQHRSDGGLQTCLQRLGYLKLITSAPTANSEIVCPKPHSPPTSEAVKRFFFSLTIVETAARWSASVACCRPRTNPITRTEKVES